MNHSVSLKKNREFQIVYRKGNSVANKYLIMYVMENGLGINRIGISASKKVGNSVVRHRVTRLIRESYRLSEDKIDRGFDCVFIARPNAKDKSYSEISSALRHLVRLNKIWQ